MPLPQFSDRKRILDRTLEQYLLDEIYTRSDALEGHPTDYTHASDIHRRKEEIACLDSILIKERERHAAKEAEFRRRWEAASKIMKQTDEAIVKLDPHYQEATSERHKELQRAAKQVSIAKAKQAELQKLNNEKKFLTEIFEVTAQRLARFVPIKKYLERVKDQSHGEFESIRELMDRFNSLKETRNQLIERSQEATEQMANRQNQLNKENTVNYNEAILLGNHLGEIEEALEQLELDRQTITQNLNSVKISTSNRVWALSNVRTATYNLYVQASALMNQKPIIPSTDTFLQLQYIQGSLHEIAKLRRSIQQILRKAIAQYQKELRKKAEQKTGQDSIGFGKKTYHGKSVASTKSGKNLANLAQLFGIKKSDIAQTSDRGSAQSNAGTTMDHFHPEPLKVLEILRSHFKTEESDEHEDKTKAATDHHRHRKYHGLGNMRPIHSVKTTTLRKSIHSTLVNRTRGPIRTGKYH